MGTRNGKKATAKPDPVAQPVDSAVGPPGLLFPFPEADAGGDTAVARKRRDEIITAATDIIASEGLHKLSLARIEERVGMSRGQLTYYFPAKEDILLAVFDRMLTRMIREAVEDADRSGVNPPGVGSPLDRVRHGMTRMMFGGGPEKTDELPALIHTFMAQVRHREDYRKKLAAANAGWRQHLAADVAAAGPAPAAPPAVVASIVMALFQGLSGQLAVDPEAFDRTAMLETCLRILTPLFSPRSDVRGEP
jgi:AcrR family transcriptional regulator